jgi:hypothetical protein
MTKSSRLVFFETCGHPEAFLIRLLKLLKRRTGALNFVEGVKFSHAGLKPEVSRRLDQKGTCLHDLVEEAFELIEDLNPDTYDQPGEFYEKLSLAISGDDTLKHELRIAMQATQRSHAYPSAVLRGHFENGGSRVILVTRSRTRQKILNSLTSIRVICVPFSDWPVKLSKSLRFGSHNSHEQALAQIPSEQHSMDSPRVIFFPHKGLNYGNLYPWEQYFSDDPSSPCHPLNLLNLDYQLNGGSLYRPLPFVKALLKMIPRCLGLIPLLSSATSYQRFHFLLRAIRLGAEVRTLIHRLHTIAPGTSTALFSYEMLTPASLSLALKAAGVTRIANLERSSVSLTGLPVLVDVLLVPNDTVEDRLRSYSLCSARTFIKVGHWRTDYIFEALNSPPKCDVLVLPYHVDNECDQNWVDPVTSCANFDQHMRTIIKLCMSHPQLDFVVRTKDLRWVTLEGLADLVQQIESCPNLSIANNYSQKAFSYALASSARLAIGRFSSIHEEILDFGTPVLIDNRSVLFDRQFQTKHLTLPADSVCDSEEALLNRANAILSENPTLLTRRNDLCDGQVRRRIVQVIEKAVALQREH